MARKPKLTDDVFADLTVETTDETVTTTHSGPKPWETSPAPKLVAQALESGKSLKVGPIANESVRTRLVGYIRTAANAVDKTARINVHEDGTIHMSLVAKRGRKTAEVDASDDDL